ncbi:ATP-grasp fold amidoligase family protein [Acholeplasma laidlawii]|uniref:ATP-grasp fold amidoligase family protein n=1 Tax=Acholeplasma laidlawii TaxID=2148 RepID=UPI003F90D470
MKRLILSIYRRIYDIIFVIVIKILGAKFYMRFKSKIKLGYKLDLENPKTYNEKLNYRKLYDKNPLFDICSNKYLVRYYVESKVGNELLTPHIAVARKLTTRVIDSLPKSFVMKTSHGSGGDNVLIVHDKSQIDWSKKKKSINKSLRRNYGYYTLENWYSNTNRYLTVEELLKIDDTFIEYKVYSFWQNNNYKSIIRVIHDRFGNKTSSFYDQNWNYIKLKYQKDDIHEPIEKPAIFEELIKNSMILSRDFDHVRVDFMYTNGKLYFGELTFADTSGFVKFDSREIDEYFGSLWVQNVGIYE